MLSGVSLGTHPWIVSQMMLYFGLAFVTLLLFALLAVLMPGSH
jgi:hypothetical protein